jgi:hypothetical protein
LVSDATLNKTQSLIQHILGGLMNLKWMIDGVSNHNSLRSGRFVVLIS